MVSPSKYTRVVILNGHYVEVRLVKINNGKRDYIVPRARYLTEHEIALNNKGNQDGREEIKK